MNLRLAPVSGGIQKGLKHMGIADDAKNTAEDLKGRAKEAVGAATGDDDLKAEGQVDQGIASVKEKLTEAADKLKEGVDAVKDKLTGNS
ncbi:CsbD-like protein [Mycobacteroides salmoniphilum]|uniref:CsbD-like protein n=2 Tax=Mycobacteroides salmoniphilum TaxID=404941 RepID=A0A4R8SVB2_9MYCO|nr:CsbD-like protein [Mycobacteroides salmoniphilum]